jgi:hypothetical protein
MQREKFIDDQTTSRQEFQKSWKISNSDVIRFDDLKSRRYFLKPSGNNDWLKISQVSKNTCPSANQTAQSDHFLKLQPIRLLHLTIF